MKKILYILIITLYSNFGFGQDYNRWAESAAREQKIPQNQISNFKLTYIANLKKELSKKNIQPKIKVSTDICDDGGFETKDFSTWGWTIVDNRKTGTSITYNSTITGSGSLVTSTIPSTTALSQWEIVSTGFDAIFPTLPTVHSGTKALKLGRSELPSILPNCSAESIEKTINITTSNKELTFWYALVLQDPFKSSNVHNTGEAPAFGVRIKSTSAFNYVPIIPVVGSGTAPIEALNNPFLTSGMPSPYTEAIAMRPWTCGKVDLSSYIGQTITIEFIVNDCSHAGHFGYAYLDDICMGCSGSDLGDASINGISDSCGLSAMISGTYTLPHSSTTTGTLNSLQAYLYQGGVPVAGPVTIPSMYITSGTFNFPITIFGSIPSGSYDIVVKGNFTFSATSFSTLSSSSGFVAGINNDWTRDCPPPANPPNPCCKNTLSMVTPVPVPPSYPYIDGTYAVELYNITAPSSAPITEIRVETTSFEWLDGPEDCKQCQIKTNNLGSLFGGVSIGGVMSGPTLQPYGSGATSSANNSEVVFAFSIPKTLAVGDFIKLTYVLPPDKELSCCHTKAKVCRKISWKDTNCGYCEVYDCSIIDLKPKSTLAPGFPMPSLQMLYLNTRGIFALGHAKGY
ncbi:hypothetical protein IV494_02040 [Kaistella sp. G5-32]|uniref:Uncharacterized protein n=1 Tax=Kaistella gelatinilytica TaxID=2787636 RepID=A0ABS0F8C4_9FLAO|nr:hypothetical protein [Kaistella gelatinilytica]MBF8455948.1 hypothetical protein [Kaistella gelatinilytica]